MADSDRGEPIDVLLVEDDEGDVLMTKEAFEYYKIRNRLHVVTDGEQALQFLRQAGPYADAPRPGPGRLDLPVYRAATQVGRDGLAARGEQPHHLDGDALDLQPVRVIARFPRHAEPAGQGLL